MFKTKLLVLLDHFLTQSHALDIVVVKALSTCFIGASDFRNLPILYLELDKFLHTLKTEEVLAAREEKELLSKQMSLADPAEVFFVVKLPLEGPLTLGYKHKEISFASELKLHLLLVPIRTFDLQVFQ